MMQSVCRLLCIAMLIMAAPATNIVLAQTPTPEQLEMLKNLPPAQREALMEQILGGRGGADVQDPALQFPQTVEPRTAQDVNRQQRNSQMVGEPRLGGGDTVLLRLEIREFTGPDEQSDTVRRSVGGPSIGQHAAPANTVARQRIDRSDIEREKLALVRDRIHRRNPYQLDSNGALDVPALGRIFLGGLNVAEARQRLAAEHTLRDYRVHLTLLPLDPNGERALKPFGYDLFAGVPTTFAPATDVPVPVDYVIGPGDRIDVQLFGSINKTYTLSVGRDGQVNFPELGPISVSGQTFADMRKSLEERIAAQMIGVRVSVSMGETRSIRIFVLGEAERPGSYSVSGLSTITNALFASGGVKPIGSLRNIQLKRQGSVVGTIDLYDLLLRGDTSNDMRLLPGDVIFIPPVGMTVGVSGEVYRPGIYELKGPAAAKELLYLAGGLTPKADPQLARLERIDEQRQRIVLDLNLTAMAGRERPLRSGDRLNVPAIRGVLEGAVALEGHVYRPGRFQYHEGLRLSDVLGSYDALKPHADPHYVLIRREQATDRAVTVLSADLAKALDAPGSAADVPLMPRDRIVVFDLESGRDRIVAPLIDELKLQSRSERPLQAVTIAGRVNAPGQYPLELGMRVSDLIRAGGSLGDAAYGGTAELARYRIVEGEYRQTELIEIDLAAALRGDEAANLALKPYDFLNIKELPQWRAQEEVEIAGEVRFPGRYPIQRGETLRSLLQRAGGLTDLAFTEGSVFLREDLRAREQQQIETLANRMEADIALLALQATQAADSQSTQALSIGQSLLAELRNTKAVGRLVLDLQEVIASAPGSFSDVVLKDGDRLMIPKRTQEVTVLGEVQTATSHLYQPGLTRDDYIGLSGGTTQKADGRRTHIVRANGSVVAGGSGWFRRSAGEIRPGDTVVVPLDAERMRPLPLWSAVTSIVYNLAIAAAAVNSF